MVSIFRWEEGIKREYRYQSGAVPATVSTVVNRDFLFTTKSCLQSSVTGLYSRSGRQGDRVISQETCQYN